VTAVLLDTWQDWKCPACGRGDRTRPLPANAQRWHTCPALHDLKTPLVPAGMDCTIILEERGDYLNGETQRTGSDGKPYMAVRTQRADGSADVAVYAPAATARLGG
jgi:hypothetical protein